MTRERLAGIVDRFPNLRLAVLGDFFLDKYLVIDPALVETSLETGRPAHQVVEIRHSPGAAGNLCSNLAALGVGELHAVGLIGDDGQGYELRQDLAERGLRLELLTSFPDLCTPTYTKPALRATDGSETETERMDVKNRAPLTCEAEARLVQSLGEIAPRVDGLIVVDQVQERNCGMITDRVRGALGELAAARPDWPVLVDSRTRIAEYRGMMLKPNQREAFAALRGEPSAQLSEAEIRAVGLELARRAERTVFFTLGPGGMLICEGEQVTAVPTLRLPPPVDIVGAGDSAAAGIMLSLCGGASPAEAALVANLVASITVQQLGTTGTATPAQVLTRFDQVADQPAFQAVR